MRLVQFSVTNFRSIRKAEKLPIGDFTVLLGPNNEGKSNILQAMALGMRVLGRSRRPERTRVRPLFRGGMVAEDRLGAFNWERDYPLELQDTAPDGRTSMRFDFELTSDEMDEFREATGHRRDPARQFRADAGEIPRGAKRAAGACAQAETQTRLPPPQTRLIMR